MTDETGEPTAEVVPNITWYFAPDQFTPVVIADSPTIIDDVDKHLGFSVYYLEGNKAEKSVQKNVYVEDAKGAKKWHAEYISTVYTKQLYKVARNLAGFAIVEANDVDLEFTPVTPGYQLTLPPIPWELLDLVDDFLRAVADKYHSEAIVLLTFDPEAKDDNGDYVSDGWGVLVPKQVNSAAHCKYDHTSVIDDKPDHVAIVGSIHSHPDMPAYASGTDHHDQADFDGIHITYGWYGKGPTEYHIEYQMQGQNWILTPDEVFEPFDDVEVTDKLQSMMDRVSTTTIASSQARAINDDAAEYYASMDAKWSGSYTGTGAAPTKYWANDEVLDPTSPHSLAVMNKTYEIPDLLSAMPVLPNYYVLVTLRTDEVATILDPAATTEVACPVCADPITQKELELRRCAHCYNFFAQPDEGLDEVVAIRKAAMLDSSELTQGYRKAKGVYAWERMDDKQTQSLRRLAEVRTEEELAAQELPDPKAYLEV